MNTTPKNVALQLGALIALYVSITSFLILAFSAINLSFPDAADGRWFYDSNQDAIRGAIAVLIVFFPTYLGLTRLVNQARRTESGFYHALTRWIIYLSLLVGGLVLLGNLVVTINAFLNGDLTLRFLLKAGTLLVVIGAAFGYYWLDAKGHWTTRAKQSVQLGVMVGVVVLAVMIYGFTLIDTPGAVRDQAIDEQQRNDLQDIQWRIEAHYAEVGELPAEVGEVYEVQEVPSAPEGRAAYEYEITGEQSYNLCAEFAAASDEAYPKPYLRTPDRIGDYQNQNWEHTAGRWCFERTVAPLSDTE